MLNACLLTSAFLIAGVSAWRIKNNVASPITESVMRTGVVMAALLAPLQLFIGDLHGLNTLEYQPAKIAAMEGIWETESGAALTLFGFPDEEKRTTHFAIKIPKAASLILKHDSNSEIKGLNEFAGEHPPVAMVFWSFRVMVGVGILMIVTAWWGLWSIYRKETNSPLLLNALSLMTFSGWVATLAGWYVTETGRQPYIVYGLLKTSETVADHSGGTLISTLTAYLVLYAALLIAYVGTLRYLAGKPARSLEHS